MALRRTKVAYCSRELLGWGASISMRYLLSDCCFYHVWYFRQSASDVVMWKGRSRTPSFTAWSYGCYTSWKFTWFAYWMESSLFCIPVLCTATYFRRLTGRNTICFYDYLALWDMIWTVGLKEFCRGEFFLSQTLVVFNKYQIKIKILSERQKLSSLEFGKGCVNITRLNSI